MAKGLDIKKPESDYRKFWNIVKSFNLEKWVDFVDDWGMSRALFLGILYGALLWILSTMIPNFWFFTLSWIIGLAPIWLPIAMLISAYKVWIWYARSLFLAKLPHTLLEMKIPREISKSPRAMETALTQFWLADQETTFIHRYVKGQVRTFYSFEIASFGGELHFYVRMPKAYQKAVEANIYSQYPEVELVEVEDYSLKFQFDPEKHTCYASDWRLESAPIPGDDPAINAYPIKTYVDYELDRDPKEEFKIDPLATTLEFMGSIKPSEQMWVQMIFTSSYRTGVLNRKDSMWKHLVEVEVEKLRILGTTFAEPSPIEITEEHLRYARPRGTWKQAQMMESMERNLSKHAFDFGMRGIYISTTQDFDRTYWNFRWMWRPFANPQYMSQLRPRRWHNPFDYPWQDFHDFRWNLHTKRFLDAYRRRSWFYPPWETPSNMMTSEVIATLFHPPSRSVTVPGIHRIPATKAEPPSNLPR